MSACREVGNLNIESLKKGSLLVHVRSTVHLSLHLESLDFLQGLIIDGFQIEHLPMTNSLASSFSFETLSYPMEVEDECGDFEPYNSWNFLHHGHRKIGFVTLRHYSR